MTAANERDDDALRSKAPMSGVLPFQLGKRIEDVTLLSKSSCLGHLGMRDLGALLDTLDQLALPAGVTIFAQGSEGEEMYFVLEGEVRLRRGSMEIGRLGPGAHFGEIAILGVRRRPSTAHAETTVRLARLSRPRFLSLSTNHPRAALHLVEALGASLAATVDSMSDDVGLLLRQRALPRRSTVRVAVSGRLVEVATGTLVSALLPESIDDALVVAATVDHRPVSLETPLTSDGRLEPLTLASWEGRRIYRASVGLLVLEAARRVIPNVEVRLGPRRGERQTVELSSDVSAETVAVIEHEMRELVASMAPLGEELWAVDEARTRFVEQGWADAALLLAFHRDKTVTLATCGRTFALGLGPVMANASQLQGFRLSREEGGVWLDFGAAIARRASTRTSALPARPTPSALHVEVAGDRHAMGRELSRWLRTLDVVSVGHFDRLCVDGQVDELIRVSEGFHEKHIGRIADRVAAARPRIVAIAGPSSSGKTTFIKRLKVQLEVNGVVPVHLSLDDYYLDRARTPQDEDGEYDFETPDAIDEVLFRSQASDLLAGKAVRTARYDFVTGHRFDDGGPERRLAERNVLLVEGIHALNPRFTGPLAAPPEVTRIFVHPRTALPFDRLSSVASEDLRLLRRIVRDRHQRGHTTSESIRRWPSVRRGEERHVSPWIDVADVVFDTGLVYELAVLRVYAERYLLEVSPDDSAYVTAYRLRQLIDRFVPIHPDRVPPTSILREFIGGSGFDV